MRAEYPKPWQSTGSGSYRALAPKLYQVRWRPLGATGPYLKRKLPGTELEIKEFLATQSAHRAMRRSGMDVPLTWNEARDLYEQKLDAKDNGEKYSEQTLELVDSLETSSGVRLVNDVGAIHIERWLQALAAATREAKLGDDGEDPGGWKSTTNKKRRMIRAFFHFLQRRHLIPLNPVDAIEPFEVASKPPRDVLPHEYAAVWQVSEPDIRDLLDWLLLTAVRFGEAAEMQRDDVVRTTIEGVELVRWNVRKRKREQPLRLMLPPVLVEILDRQPQVNTPAGEDDGKVWHKWTPPRPESKKGATFKKGAPLDVFWFDKVLGRRCELAKVPRFSAHALRHAAASWAAADVNALGIKGLLGHAQLSTSELYIARKAEEDGARVVQSKLLAIRAKALGQTA